MRFFRRSPKVEEPEPESTDAGAVAAPGQEDTVADEQQFAEEDRQLAAEEDERTDKALQRRCDIPHTATKS